MAGSMESTGREYLAKLKPGLAGEFVLSSGTHKGRYKTIVEEIDGSMVSVQPPMTRGALLEIYRGMEFCLATEDASALYEYDMTIVRIRRGAGPELVCAELTGDVRRIQRRHFLRVACDQRSSRDGAARGGIDALEIFDAGRETDEPMSSSWRKARPLDISLRGIRFQVDDIASEPRPEDAVMSGSKLMMSFILLGRRYWLVGTAARVVRADDDSGQIVGASFDSVGSSIEKKLFEFIRAQEIANRDE